MYPVWAGILIILSFNASILVFAIFYPFIWYDLFQRFEPFTRQFARIAQKRPWFFYGIVGLLALAALITTIHSNIWYWQVIHAEIVFGLGWLVGHIFDASQDPLNPPHMPAFIAVPRRLFKRALKSWRGAAR